MSCVESDSSGEFEIEWLAARAFFDHQLAARAFFDHQLAAVQAALQ